MYVPQYLGSVTARASVKDSRVAATSSSAGSTMSKADRPLKTQSGLAVSTNIL